MSSFFRFLLVSPPRFHLISPRFLQPVNPPHIDHRGGCRHLLRHSWSPSHGRFPSPKRQLEASHCRLYRRPQLPLRVTCFLHLHAPLRGFHLLPGEGKAIFSPPAAPRRLCIASRKHTPCRIPFQIPPHSGRLRAPSSNPPQRS